MEQSGAIVMTAVAGEEDAERIAGVLVEERLAGCVQELAIRSRYRWEGETKVEPEVLLLIKTTASGAGAVKARLGDLHPYEVPEVMVVAASGSDSYLAWMAAEVPGT